MNLIEKLGLEKCKQIVDGAPEWAKCYYDGFYIDRKTHSKCVRITDLRAALADHDRTDYVSDIRNHIAPTTVIMER